MSELYDTDIAAWAEQQASLLRRLADGERINSNELDWSGIAEEIEDVAGRHKDQIESRLAMVCQHLLKWQDRRKRGRSLRGPIVEARTRIAQLIRRNPSLQDYPAEVLADAYADGRVMAMVEAGLRDLPKDCPWTLDEVLDRNFWPEDPPP